MKTGDETQGEILLRSPAKITPHLRVIGKRHDGFHEVRLTLVPISIFDFISITPQTSGGVQLRVNSRQPLGREQDNLVFRAAVAFQRRANLQVHAVMRLAKQIPVGAGLGGGSGNAAAVLLFLNRLHGRPLSADALESLALSLGSDVPFFLNPQPATAGGRGETLTGLAGVPRMPLLVVQPPFGISTSEAYAAVQPSRREDLPALGTVAEIAESLCNDFEATVFRAHPLLSEVRGELLRSGALGAGMSGTGSALFGIYGHDGARDAALAGLRLPTGCRVWSCETLTSHDYWDSGSGE